MNRSGRPPSSRPSRKSRSRPVLRGEQLENRSLLDGAAGANVLLHYLSSSGQSVYHNPSMPSDVDANAQVSLADLVHLSNDLRANGQRALNPAGSALGGAAGESGSQHFFVDVNGDNQADFADMKALAGTLGGANAQPDQVAITFTVTDTSNNPLPVDGGGIAQINIGDHYLLHMQVDDLRTSALITKPGVDLAYVDITYDAALTTPISGTITTPAWYGQENTYTNISVAGEIGNFGAKATAGLPYDNGLETLMPAPIEMISVELVGTFAGLVTFTSNNPWFFEGAPAGFDIAVQQDPPFFINSVPFDEVIFGSVQVNIAVVGVVAQDDIASTSEDPVTPLMIPIGGGSGLTDNDLAEAGGSVVFVGVGASGAATASTSQGGTVTVSGGNVLYTPAPDFFGVDTFEYKIENGSNPSQTDVGMVSVTVTQVNDAPHAVDDTVNTGRNIPVSIPFATILGNDWAGNIGDNLERNTQTLTVKLGPFPGGPGPIPTLHFGTAVINGTNIDYTPPLDYTGPDSFQYSIEDNGTTNGTSDPLHATGTINVNVGINAVPDAFTVQQGSTTSLDVLANDAPASARVVAIATAPTNGSASVPLDGLSVTYTAPAVPGLNSITDTFRYTIDDGLGHQATTTVTITVNAPPDAIDDGPIVVVQNSSNNIIPVLANDLVGAGEIKILSGIPTPPSHGSAFINGLNQLVYSPAPSYFGPDTFVYRLSDGNGGFDNATVTINVIVPPSIIRGIVYFDVNNDGIRNAPTSAPVGSTDPAKYIALHTESAMAGVTIQLYAGSSAVGVPIATTTTAADGTYTFGIADNIQPGTYTLKQVQPAATIDGVETYTPVGVQPSQVVGVSTAADSTQDTITFTLTGSIDAGGFNFAERGLQPPFVNIQGGYLTSTPQDSLTAAYDLVTGQLWYSFRVSSPSVGLPKNWDLFNSAKIVLTQDNTTTANVDETKVQLDLTETSTGDLYHTTFGKADPQYQNFKILGQVGNVVVIRFNGPASNFSPFLPGAGPEADDHDAIDSFFSGGGGL